MNFNYAEILKLVVPETIVVIAALVALMIDLVVMRDEPIRYRKGVLAAFSSFGCLFAIMATAVAPQYGTVLNGMLAATPLTQFVKQVILALTIFTVIISVQSNFTQHVGEYFALLLLASAGMMFLVSSEHLLMIFVALELTSLSLYIITAFNKESLRSAEAALKYFLFGGMSAAFTLFGLSLIYGLSNELNLAAIAENLKGQTADPLFLVALVMVLIGFGFKIAAAPFHLWAPDAYEGAPTASASFIAAGSKVASFFILAKILMLGFAGAEGSGAWRGFSAGWIPLLAAIAACSMLLGNLAAIVQSSVKRLLAYSAIAHAGYALLAIMTNHSDGVSSLLYYVVTYALTTLGAFAVVAIVEHSSGDKLADFAGLSRRAPVMSACMLIFLLSLAGIPPLAGFFGKFYVFTNAIRFGGTDLGLLWLVILAIGTSAISLYYYLQVLKQIYVADAPVGGTPINASVAVQTAVIALAAAVVVLGCAPDLLLARILAALLFGM